MTEMVEMNKSLQMTMILALVGVVLANVPMNQSFAYTSTSAEKAFFGHFTLTVKDEFGNIKDYLEFDNVITDEGDACIASLVFSPGGDASTCTNGVIDAIVVADCSIDNVCAAVSNTTTTFDDSTSADLGDTCETAADTTRTYTNRVNNGGTQAKVRLSTVIDNLDLTYPFTAREAGILNGCTAGDQLFAISTFSDVSLSGSDTLTINYDIAYSG